MNWHPVVSKLRSVLKRRSSERDFDEEVESHIALLAARFVAQGMTEEQALDAARRQFGNSTSLREVRREMQGFVWLETLWQDLRYGGRTLRKNKAFAVVAILTLALGIGANTAIFSVVNAVLLRPLPYPEPERLVILWGNVKRVKVERRGASYPDYLDWRTQSRSFEAMAAGDEGRFALTGIEPPDRVFGEYVSHEYFSLLGVRPAQGRTFRSEEDQVPQRDAVVILSDGTWKRRFGGDPGIVGRTIQLDGRAFVVIGIAPPGFQGLTDRAELWVPFVMAGSATDLAERGSRGFQVLARLRRGVSREGAQADMDAISRRLAQAYPATNDSRAVEVASLENETFGDVRKPLLILMASVGFVLLIAVTNVTNLLLARSEARQQEIAARTALGASSGRIVRQLLAESSVLVTVGCIAGLIFARFGTAALIAGSPLRFPSYVQPGLEPRVVLFTLAVSCIMALALGLAPAIQVSGRRFTDALRETTRTTTAGRRVRLRDLLIVTEIALSMMLLVGAGLMMRSLKNLAELNPGYDPNHVVSVRISLPRLQPPPAAAAPTANSATAPNSAPDIKVAVAATDILSRISKLPSVEAASASSDVPMGGSGAIFYAAEGQPPMNAQNAPRAYFHRVSPNFFQTLRAQFIAGRGFTEDEVRGNANVAVVTDNMVRRFWPGENPIGKRIKVGGPNSQRPWLAIVGVVKELKYRGLPENPTADPDLFQVFNERSRDFSVLVRTSLDANGMTAAVRAALREADPTIIIYNAGTLEKAMEAETARPRFTGWLMTIFATLALGLAAIGIYGVMAYTVTRRTREIGLRMALGAARSEVMRLVVGRGLVLAVAGLVAGAAAALLLTRLMATLVYGVSATDPLTFVGASATLIVSAILACLVPATRATRIDPAIALRYD